MEWEEVQLRLNNIVQVDVMTNEEWDFSATHIPFNRLSVQYSGRVSDVAIDMTEEEVYQKLVYNPKDEHRLIIVRGPNGAGKSHLIRWMKACKNSSIINELDSREKVVFIRRIDNTLRGAMRQLLEQDIVSDPQQKERMKQFIQATDVLNEAQLRSTIYYTFITYVETDTSLTGYRHTDRKRLASLLRDDRIKDFLMRPEGPVMRYYELLAQPPGLSETREASFLPDDFIKMRDIINEVERDSSTDVKSMIRRVISPIEASKLANYLNSFSQTVIQNCANIAQGDIEEIIRQLRTDLKRQEKTLTILIEDFTTFTGIDSELLKVLSIKHGGEYKDLCCVTAIVGITDAYYESRFLDNYKDRVTHQITVDNNAYGDKEFLAQMAARYINAAYLTTSQVKTWFEQGAHESTLPYATYTPYYNWEDVDVDGRNFSLFPFNRKVLMELYERLSEKTPRFFLKDIIRIQMSAFVQEKMGHPSFPNVKAITGPAIQFKEAQHASRFEGLPIPQSDKPRLRALLCLWGEGNLIEEKKHNFIGGLPIEFLKEFKFEISGIENHKKPIQKEIPEKKGKQFEVPTNREYQNMVDDIENWFQGNKVLNTSEDMRALLRDFLTTSINWQMEGVPAYLAGAKLSNTRGIYIEGQRQQGQDRDKAIIIIDRDLTGYNVLQALCHWRHNNRRWDFKDSAFFQFKLVAWLESSKNSLISQIRGEPEETPDWTLQCSMALEYLRLGLLGYLKWNEEDASVIKKMFTKSNLSIKITRSDEDEPWSRVLKNLMNKTDILEKNKELLIMMPNSQMGRVTDIRVTKFLFNRDQIDEAYEKLNNLEWDASSMLPCKNIEREDLQSSAARMLQSLLPNIKIALVEEQKKATKILKQIKEYLGENISESSLVDISREMVGFLNALNNTYHISYSTSMRTNAEQIEKDSKKLADISNHMIQINNSVSFKDQVSFFSSDPCYRLHEVVETMKDIESLAKKVGENAKNELSKMKKSDSSEEPRINLLEDGLVKLKEKVEAIKGDNDA
jgi:hypothetical protein